MDKLQMAHEYFQETIKFIRENSINHEFNEIIKESWEYADAMQAEADKRAVKGVPEALQQTFIDGVEQPRYAPSCEDWQPDWSQAPDDADIWTMSSAKQYYWFNSNNCPLGNAPSFNYQGNWQDSLRKRP